MAPDRPLARLEIGLTDQQLSAFHGMTSQESALLNPTPA
jgi:hypothetical protein